MAKKKALMECPHKKQEDSMRQTHKRLEKKGWLRQFVAGEAQVKDAVEIYDLLGYDVHLQPPDQTHSKKRNSSSSKESEGQCRVVYIRPKQSPDGEQK
jgi:hypothetical protein